MELVIKKHNIGTGCLLFLNLPGMLQEAATFAECRRDKSAWPV
jgi:hypothetical protein